MTAALSWDPSLQIRSKERVRNLAEVYTHEREVNAMLDLVADMFPSVDDPENIDRTFLEPACGNGNFLVEILTRKLAGVLRMGGDGVDVEYRIVRCFTSIYGIDIYPSNVEESRDRMWEVLEKVAVELPVGEECAAAVRHVLGTNIICADTLADAKSIQIVEYKPVGDGFFIREWGFLDETEPAEQMDLFAEVSDGPLRDAVAMHYSQLANTRSG